jgi:ribosomal protein S12 methylthiotransferase accessory factor
MALDTALSRKIATSLNDPARIRPIIAGPSLISGGRMSVRLVHGDIEITASAKMLKRIFAMCDGTRSIVEILQRIVNTTERSRFKRFINFLL